MIQVLTNKAVLRLTNELDSGSTLCSYLRQIVTKDPPVLISRYSTDSYDVTLRLAIFTLDIFR